MHATVPTIESVALGESFQIACQRADGDVYIMFRTLSQACCELLKLRSLSRELTLILT